MHSISSLIISHTPHSLFASCRHIPRTENDGALRRRHSNVRAARASWTAEYRGDSVRRFFIAIGLLTAAGFGEAATKAVMAANLTLPMYKVQPAPAPLWTWTGFYVGGNAGLGIGHDPVALTAPTVAALPGNFETFSLSPFGFAGGGQAGYNWQFAPNWVVGVEGDWQWTNQRDSACTFACGSTVFFTQEQELNWFATARARLGYTDGNWLWYATGGGAWGSVHDDFGFIRPASMTNVARADFGLDGFVVGAGVETHFSGPWTGKLEYLYMDLGAYTDTTVGLGGNQFSMNSKVHDNIVRVGLNYNFR